MGPGGKGTVTGKTLESVIRAVLETNGYHYEEQKVIGKSIYGGDYRADFVIGEVIISCKWQQTQGTAEQKIIYEIASLIQIIKNSQGKYRRAYIVIGGKGFSKNALNYLLNQRFRDIFVDGNLVEIKDLDSMITLINKGSL